MAQSYAKYTCWYGFWIKRDEIAADVNKCLPPSCFTTVPDSTLVALLGKVLVHWIQTAAVAPAQLLNTETRTRILWTRYARILKIGFSGSAGLSSPSGNGVRSTRTERPEPPAQQHSPEQHQSASYWSGRALEIHVLTLMGAVRQYQSHTAGNLSKPNIAPVI